MDVSRLEADACAATGLLHLRLSHLRLWRATPRFNVGLTCPRSCAYREVNSERVESIEPDKGDQFETRIGTIVGEGEEGGGDREEESREEGWERADLILERASSSFYTRWFYIRPLSCYRASPYGCVGRAFTVSPERSNTRGRANTSENLGCRAPLW